MSIQTAVKPIEILLVEDKPADTRLYRQTLVGSDSSQFDLTCVKNLDEASGRLTVQEFDVVLLDISMSDNGGFDTFINLRMLAPKIPIILLSSSNDEELAVKSLQNGAQDYLIKGQFNSSMLARSIRYAIERHRIMTDLVHTRQKEYRLAYFDALTELPNRQLFYDRLNQALSHAHRYKDKVALMFIDLDGFKHVNDTKGHSAGDLLLKAVANRLKGCLRNSDTVARMGGDEFTCILPGVEKKKDVTTVAQKINRTLAFPFEVRGEDIYISGSTGISIFPDDTSDLQSLVKNADMAMYHAKKQGKNNFRFYNRSLNIVTSEHILPDSSLLKAIQRNSFTCNMRS